MTTPVSTTLNATMTPHLRELLEALIERESDLLKQATDLHLNPSDCLHRIYNNLLNFHENQANSLKDTKQRIIAQCEEIREWITTHKRLLGQYTSGTPSRDPSKTIQENLQQLQREYTAVHEEFGAKLKHVEDMKKQLRDYGDALQRSSAIKQLIEQVGNDMSVAAISMYEEELKSCISEYTKRHEITKDTTTQLLHLLKQLKPSKHTDIDTVAYEIYAANDTSLKNQQKARLLTENERTEMERRIDELMKMKQQHLHRINRIKEETGHIINRIGLDAQQYQEVMDSLSRGCSHEDVKNAEDTLQRYTQLKKEKLGEFILNAKKALHEAWDLVFYTDSQRRLFEPAFVKEVSEDVLDAIEKETRIVNQEYQDYKILYDLVRKHKKLLKDYQEFQESTADSSRLLEKKSCRDPGRLLREEKTRKRFNVNIVKTAHDLEALMLEYEGVHGKPFYIGETPYLSDVIYADRKGSSISNIINSSRSSSSTSGIKRRSRDVAVPQEVKKQKTLKNAGIT